MKVKLRELAYARTGDKGDNLNIGVLARDEAVCRTLKGKPPVHPQEFNKAGLSRN